MLVKVPSFNPEFVIIDISHIVILFVRFSNPL